MRVCSVSSLQFSALQYSPELIKCLQLSKWLPTTYLYLSLYDKHRQCIKKQRHLIADQVPYNQSYDFSSRHVQMWDLDHKENWAPNWCFWTVVLEKTPQSPLDCKEVKPVNSKGNQPWVFTERTDAEVEAPMLWPPDVKSQLTAKNPEAGKDWRQEERGATENEMVGWHRQLNGLNEFEHTPGDTEGQGSLAGMLQSMGSGRVRHNLATKQQIQIYHYFSTGLTTYMLKRIKKGHYTLLCPLISTHQFMHSTDWALTTFCILC